MSIQISFQLACDDETLPQEEEMQRWIKAAVPPHQTLQLNVRLVNTDEMQALNKQYRKKDNVTDILSFPFAAPEGFETDFIGDIVLCPTRIKEDALKQQKKWQDHWAHLLVHGTLHLLGYDHYTDPEADVMMAREVEILSLLNIPNPYEN